MIECARWEFWVQIKPSKKFELAFPTQQTPLLRSVSTIDSFAKDSLLGPHRKRSRHHQTLTSTTLISQFTEKSFFLSSTLPFVNYWYEKNPSREGLRFFFGKRSEKHFFRAILHFSAHPTREFFVCDSFSSDDDEMEMEMCRRIG